MARVAAPAHPDFLTRGLRLWIVAALMHASAAAITFGFLWLAPGSPEGRLLVWAASAGNFHPQDYAAIGSLSIALQAGTALVVVWAIDRVRNRKSNPRTTLNVAAAPGVACALHSLLGGGGFVGLYASLFTLMGCVCVGLALAPRPVPMPVPPVSVPYPEGKLRTFGRRWSPVLVILGLLWVGLDAVLTSTPLFAPFWVVAILMAVVSSVSWSGSRFAARGKLSARFAFLGALVLTLEYLLLGFVTAFAAGMWAATIVGLLVIFEVLFVSFVKGQVLVPASPSGLEPPAG